MEIARLEQWTIGVLDRLRKKEPIEDSRVELKREWPDPVKAARRIAGHANAAGGVDILWIIGADEVSGIPGAAHREFAEWFAQVDSFFDEIVPVVHDVNVSYQGTTVVALQFETNRAPFVVKNPMHGKPGGGSVSLEVPWREATAIRSARREDLIRILVPLMAIPTIELLEGEVCLDDGGSISGPDFHVEVGLYATPTGSAEATIPFHKISGELRFSGAGEPIHPRYLALNAEKSSTSISESRSELVIRGPGHFILYAGFASDSFPTKIYEEAHGAFQLGFAGAEQRIGLSCVFGERSNRGLRMTAGQVIGVGGHI